MVVDSSAALSWAFVDERTPASQALFTQAVAEQVHVPAIWPFEIANKLVIGLRKGRLSEREFEEAFAGFQLLNVKIHPTPSIEALAKSARRHDLTAYDAAFVELALREGQPLATFDGKMRAAASAVGIAVLP